VVVPGWALGGPPLSVDVRILKGFKCLFLDLRIVKELRAYLVDLRILLRLVWE
jgi:hypothetical protein